MTLSSQPEPRAARPPEVGQPDAEHRQWDRELAAVARQGPTRVAELLLAARSGDRRAAAMSVGAVLRALPGVGWLTARDMLLRAGVPQEETALGHLTLNQRAALVAELAHMPTPRPDG